MHGYCQMAVVQLLDEASAAAGDVDVFADQIAVDAIREVDEVEIEIVDAAAELGGEVIAQVFRIQMIEIAARLDESAAALAHLGAVDRQIAVDVQRGWRAESRTVQHCRPEQTVEIHDVPADGVVPGSTGHKSELQSLMR